LSRSLRQRISTYSREKSPAVEGTAITDLIAGSRQRRDSLPKCKGWEEHNIDEYNHQTNLLHLLNARDLPGRFVNFSMAHVYLLDLDPWQKANMEAHPDYMGMLQSYAQTGPAITALDDGKPALSFGVVPFYPGVAEAWMLRGDLVSAHPLSVAYGARMFFDHLGHIMGLWRCQIGVQSSNDRATRFAKFLKFETEGLMRQFGPERSDFYMMARLYHGRNTFITETSET